MRRRSAFLVLIVIAATLVAVAEPATAGTISFAVTNVGMVDEVRTALAADIDGDGRLDLVAARSNFPESKVRVALQRADGTYASPVSTSFVGYLMDLDAADFDGDGDRDLVAVTQRITEEIVLLEHIGGGRFDESYVHAGPENPSTGVTVGDANRDGRVDVVVDMTGPGGRLKLLRGGGNMTLGAPEPLPALAGTTTLPTRPELLDVDGDGRLDVVSRLHDSPRVVIHRGRGDGTFDPPRAITTPMIVNAVDLGDYDNDGVIDLVAGGASGVFVLLARGNLTYATGPSISTSSITDVAAVDVDGDGYVDAVGSDPDGKTVHIAQGTKYVTFIDRGLFVFGQPVSVSVGDLDRDLRPDIVVGDRSGKRVTVLRNTSAVPARTVDVYNAFGTEQPLDPRGGRPATIRFTVKRLGDSTRQATVVVRTRDGSAVGGSDFVANGDTVTFPPNVNTRFFVVTLLNDGIAEPTEQFYAALENPSGLALGRALATGTIGDDDAAPTLPVLTIADASVTEPDGAATTQLRFVVRLSAASASDITVRLGTADGTATTADDDYVAKTVAAFRIPAGSTTKELTVKVNGDGKAEADETLRVVASNVTGATLGDAEAIGTIRNDD